MLYETLRYSWAWKHLGLVDYLARHHTVDTHVTNLNAYQSWPGFFSVAATWLVGSHASSWIGPAQWAPLFFELLDVLALYAVFVRSRPTGVSCGRAIWFFALGNWIGQDYFSPQAFAFFLYLVVILLVVRYFGRRPALPGVVPRAAFRARRESSSRGASRHATRSRRSTERAATAAMGLVLLCTAAIASSHPLTPFVLVAAVVVVGVAGGLRVRRLPRRGRGRWSRRGCSPARRDTCARRFRRFSADSTTLGRHRRSEPVEIGTRLGEPASRVD